MQLRLRPTRARTASRTSSACLPRLCSRRCDAPARRGRPRRWRRAVALVDVDEKPDLDAVAVSQRNPIEGGTPDGTLASKRLRHTGELGEEAAQKRASEQPPSSGVRQVGRRLLTPLLGQPPAELPGYVAERVGGGALPWPLDGHRQQMSGQLESREGRLTSWTSADLRYSFAGRPAPEPVRPVRRR
jgi:hypothetical protein